MSRAVKTLLWTSPSQMLLRRYSSLLRGKNWLCELIAAPQPLQQGQHRPPWQHSGLTLSPSVRFCLNPGLPHWLRRWEQFFPIPVPASTSQGPHTWDRGPWRLLTGSSCDPANPAWLWHWLCPSSPSSLHRDGEEVNRGGAAGVGVSSAPAS